MPLASACSAAISAACHPPLPDEDEAYRFLVRWGVVSEDDKGVGHCPLLPRGMLQRRWLGV